MLLIEKWVMMYSTVTQLTPSNLGAHNPRSRAASRAAYSPSEGTNFFGTYTNSMMVFLILVKLKFKYIMSTPKILQNDYSKAKLQEELQPSKPSLRVAPQKKKSIS